MDSVLAYLGIARMAGLLETGEKNCGIAVRGGKAKLLLLAADASPNAIRRAQGFIYGKKTVLLQLPLTKEKISQRVGRPGCSMVTVTDLGLAASLAEALAGAVPGMDVYTEAAKELQRRRMRADRRKTEARAHERNKKMGKRRKTV